MSEYGLCKFIELGDKFQCIKKVIQVSHFCDILPAMTAFLSSVTHVFTFYGDISLALGSEDWVMNVQSRGYNE